MPRTLLGYPRAPLFCRFATAADALSRPCAQEWRLTDQTAPGLCFGALVSLRLLVLVLCHEMREQRPPAKCTAKLFGLPLLYEMRLVVFQVVGSL